MTFVDELKNSIVKLRFTFKLLDEDQQEEVHDQDAAD